MGKKSYDLGELGECHLESVRVNSRRLGSTSVFSPSPSVASCSSTRSSLEFFQCAEIFFRTTESRTTILYIIGRFCVCVTKNEHFAQLSQINFYFYFQVGFHGFSWFQVGLSWFQVCFHGFSWFQVGFSWFLMVFHGFS